MPTIEGDIFIPEGFFEVAFTHALTGSLRRAVCTLGVQYTGSDFGAESNELLDGWATTFVASMADVWTYVEGKMRNQIGTVKTRAETTVGGTSHTPTSPNVTFLLHKDTGLPGRFNRGRLYLPGVSEQDVDAVGTVAGSKITELELARGNFETIMTANHFTPVILHRDFSTDGGVTFTHRDPTTIVGMRFDPLAATQRRRMRR